MDFHGFHLFLKGYSVIFDSFLSASQVTFAYVDRDSRLLLKLLVTLHTCTNNITHVSSTSIC